MDITRIPGIGKKSKIYYQKKGIERIGDIINTPLPKMMELFGKRNEIEFVRMKNFYRRIIIVFLVLISHASIDKSITIPFSAKR